MSKQQNRNNDHTDTPDFCRSTNRNLIRVYLGRFTDDNYTHTQGILLITRLVAYPFSGARIR